MKDSFLTIPKKNQMALLIVGIATLIIAVIGAAYAYFTASGVSGNVTENNVNVLTASYGALTVTYPNGSNINMDSVDLPQSGGDALGMLKFSVATTAEATVNQRFTIKWGGDTRISNNFVQYVKPNGTPSETAGYMCYGGSALGTESQATCQNVSGASWTAYTDVRDELVYVLYSCTTSGYNTVSTTVQTGCTAVNTPNINGTSYSYAPFTTLEKSSLLTATQTIDISVSRTNYYALLLTIKNKATKQDYQQGKSFTGSLIIENAT